jgi:hypothetical protein
VYANWMDWTDKTTRPTHARVAELAGVSERTVKRVVAWLHDQKYMGTVTPGMIPRYRPGRAAVLDPGNEAAEYVLTIPARHTRQLPALNQGSDQFGPPSMFRKEHRSTPHEPDAGPGSGAAWNLGDRPENRTEQESAAQAMRQRCSPLRRLSDRHVAAIARPLLGCGWTPADVLHALDWQPPAMGGHRWTIAASIAEPAAWARWRLGYWRHPDGTPITPPSQHAAQADAERRAAQAERKASQAQAAADRLPDHAQAAAGAAARTLLTGTSTMPASTLPAAGLGDVHGTPRQHHHEPAPVPARTSPGSVDPHQLAAAATKPPRDGAGLARARLGITDPARRDAIITAWHATRTGKTGAL